MSYALDGIPTRARLVEFRILCEQNGLVVPPPTERALQLLQVASDHERAAELRNVLELSDEEARDWITQHSIRQHEGYNGGTKGMNSGRSSFETRVLLDVAEASRPYLDDLVVQMQPGFDAVAAPIVHAAQVYGFSRSTDPGSVIDMADERASAAYRAARDAIGAIAPIARLRIQISKTFGVGPSPDDFNWFLGAGQNTTNNGGDFSIAFAAGDTWGSDGEFYVEGRTGGGTHLDWLRLAAGGLRLNTPSECDVKIQERRVSINVGRWG